MSEQEALLSAHQGWACSVALRLGRRLPSWVDRDDLVSAAMLGLWQAVQRFDPARGVPLRAFAYHAVRGAVYMRVRRREWTEHGHDALSDQIPTNGAHCPETRAAERERQRQARAVVIELVSRLDPESRRVVIRHWIDGLPLYAIAGEMDEQPSRIYYLHGQAMKQMAATCPRLYHAARH